ncbi:MAG TPA: DUF4381 domain-containing protein [Xanthomonadaceae bacterium]|nr:DUF4381 domain-containing protein [Xanthomonadaceae bacterium]
MPALRDIHLPPSPGWWPPAPGWWMLAALLSIASVWGVRRALRMRKRWRRIAASRKEYDRALDAACDAPGKLAAASLLLRRAAKAHDPRAASLEGEAWLRYLDGDDPVQPFSTGAGKLLRDGGFRREVADDVAPTLMLARQRFVALLERDHA